MVFRGETTGSSPGPQRVARQTTIYAKPTFFASQAKPKPKPKPKPAPAPHYSAPAPRRTSTSSSGQIRSSGPSTGGRAARPTSSGGGNKGQGKVQGPGKKAPAPKSSVPTIQKFLNSDVGYQGGLSELMKTLAQFNAQNSGQVGDVKEAFATAMQRMGDERSKSLQSLADDFSSRGLINSGLYTGAVSDYNTEYNQRVQDLNTDQQNQLENLATERSNNASLIGGKKADLRLDAIRRRAEKYNAK